MKKIELLQQTADNLREIRELVERGDLDESQFPLHTFRYDDGRIGDIIKDLYEGCTNLS